MVLKAARATLAVLAAAGSIVVVSGTAEAAAPRCTTGNWRLTGAKAVSKGIGTNVTTQGGAGTTMKVGPQGQVVFTFNASKRVNHKGKLAFRPFQAWVKYDKVLRLKFAVVGGRSGTVTAKLRTAAGNATSHGQVVRPERKVIRKQRIAPAVRRGGEAIIPSKAGFTCNGTTLHLRQKSSRQGVTTVADWWFRRIVR